MTSGRIQSRERKWTGHGQQTGYGQGYWGERRIGGDRERAQGEAGAGESLALIKRTKGYLGRGKPGEVFVVLRALEASMGFDRLLGSHVPFLPEVRERALFGRWEPVSQVPEEG